MIVEHIKYGKNLWVKNKVFVLPKNGVEIAEYCPNACGPSRIY